MTTWFAPEIEGSLSAGARSRLVWPERGRWIDMVETDPDRRVSFRWAWLRGDANVTEVTLDIAPRGYGSRVVLQDGPFDVTQESQLDAYAASLEGWTEALANLRSVLDFSVDIRRVRGLTLSGPR